MAAGAALAGALWGEHPNVAAALGVRRDIALEERELVTPGSGVTGAVEHTNVGVRSFDFAGADLAGFMDVFYSRVYFIPPLLDFGAIAGRASLSFQVWNAHLDPIQITDVALADFDGLEVEGPTTPVSMLALELVEYTITASLAGPPSVAAAMGFSFSTGEETPISILGTRALLAPFIVNWRRAATVTYAYKTDVIRSRSGKEQRRALRQTPRKTLEFDAQVKSAAFVEFQAIMAAWQNNVIVVEEPGRDAPLAAVLPAGSKVVTLGDDAPSWLRAGSNVILQFGDRRESNRVVSAVGPAVTLSAAFDADWPVGTKVHYAVSGRLDTALKTRRETDRIATMTVSLEVVPGSEPVLDPPDAAVTFGGREVFTKRFNWADRPEATYEAVRENVDYGWGRTEVFRPQDFGTILHRLTFLNRNKAEAEAIREFFERHRGQRGEFYRPSWETDIILKQAAPQGTRDLRVAGPFFAKLYGGSTVHRAVSVYTKAGELRFYAVEDIFEITDSEGNDSVLQVGADLVEDTGPETVRMVSWLYASRFASDQLPVEWLTNAVAQAQITFRTLEDLGP